VTPGELLARAVAAAEAAGEQIRAEFYRAGGPRGSRAKAPIDEVVETQLREALQAALACDFVGEESGLARGSVPGYRWIVDPHDGTSDFLKGHRGSAVSIGLLRDGVPVLGVVHAPLSPDRGRETFAWAEGAGPLRRNGVPVPTVLSARRLCAGEIVWCTEAAELRAEAFARAVAPARFVAMTSIAHRLARVAAGDGVAAVSAHGVHEHDIAAGAALLRAVGGVVRDGDGREFCFSGGERATLSGCVAGAPEAVRALGAVGWQELNETPKSAPRVPVGFPRVADEALLARAQGCLLGQLIAGSLAAGARVRDAASLAGAQVPCDRGAAEGANAETLAGQPSPDSELALALARSIVRAGRYDAAHALEAYRRWIASLACADRRSRAETLAGDAEAKGLLVRVAPIGIWAAGDPARAALAARADARLSRADTRVRAACASYAAAIAAGVASGDRDATIRAALERGEDATREAIEKATRREPPSDAGACADGVEAALQNAFYQLVHAANFEVAVAATLARGGDATVNAAIAGALVGACAGRQALPAPWLLAVLSCRPCEAAGAKRPRPSEYWPDDLLQLAEALLLARGSAGGSS